MAALVLGYATAASADDTLCPPDPGAVMISGNVVATGACVMTGTTVMGNVIVLPGGSLMSTDSIITGNLSSDGALFVDVLRGSVAGNVLVKNSTGVNSIVDVTITENLQYEENPTASLLACNTVGGNLQAHKNTGLDITNNSIAENLQCNDNVGLTGSANSVGDLAQGDCAGFVGAPAAVCPF